MEVMHHQCERTVRVIVYGLLDALASSQHFWGGGFGIHHVHRTVAGVMVANQLVVDQLQTAGNHQRQRQY